MCKCHLNKSTTEISSVSSPSLSPKTSTPVSSPTQTNSQLAATRETVDHLYSQMQTYKAILAVDSAHWEGYTL